MKQLHRAFALLLTLCFCLWALPPVYAAPADEARVLTISTISEFTRFAQNCTRDVWSKDLVVELNSDLNLNGIPDCVVPYFQGTFHGNGHTIRGLTIDQKGSKQGLFRTLTETALVQDLTVDGTISLQGSGSMAGLIAGENLGLIQNCTAMGSVKAVEQAGGLVGINYETGRIETCENQAAVSAELETGGIAGQNSGTVYGCLNLGSVNTTDEQKTPMDTGGIAGSSQGLVDSCRNSGEVGYSHIGYNVGGIVGRQTGETRNCTGSGTVNGRKDVGGITGQLEPDTQVRSSASPFDSIDAGMNSFISQLEEYSAQLDQIAARGSAGGQVINGSLDQIQNETTAAANSFSEDLKNLSDDLENAGDSVSDVLKALREGIQDNTQDWSTGTQTLIDNVDAQVEVIQNQLKASTDQMNQDSAVLREISGRMNKSLHQVRQGVQQLGEAPQLTVEDCSETITEGNGLITGCTALGKIYGDANVGGIAGTLSVEVQGEPETNLAVEDANLLADTTVKLWATVRDCRFEGDAEAKNDCAGGIVGRGEIGAVLNCTAKGTVSAGTDCCGGIAGRMRGSILNCAALTDLSAAGWLGGIAGFGSDITDCVSMTRADSEGEFVGAVAGETDGDLVHNFYLLEDLAGLDGVDYTGHAQGLTFEEFSALENVPADFLTFSYRFVDKGRTVAEIFFDYGDDLDKSQVPPPPTAQGQTGFWPEYPVHNLRRSMVLEACFEEPGTTVASEGNFPLLLAEGSFMHGAAVAVEQTDLPAAVFEGKTPVAAYCYTVSGSCTEPLLLRLRADQAQYPAAAVLQGTDWVIVPTVQDGSYLVLADQPEQGTVLLLSGTKPFPTGLVTGAGALVVLVVLLLLFRRKKKKSAGAKPADNAPSHGDEKQT